MPNTTLLSQDQVDFVRSTRKSAAVWMVMSLIELTRPGRAITAEEVGPILEMDIRTADKHMASLCAANRAIFDGRGYVLINKNALLLGTQAHAYDPAALAHPQDEGREIVAHQALTANAQSLQESHTQFLRALKKEEEESGLNSKSSTSSLLESESQTLRDMPETADILAATAQLDKFGLGVLANGLDVEQIDPRLALMWIAQAFDQRERLGNPAGLVYSRLRDRTQPKPYARYQYGWVNILPNDWLAGLGLAELVEVVEVEEDAAGDEIAEPLVIDPHAHATWEKVKDQLQQAFAKAHFTTWIQGTFGIAIEDQTITVGAQNAFAVDWLARNLDEGKAGMRVEFVVAEM